MTTAVLVVQVIATAVAIFAAILTAKWKAEGR